MTIEDSLITAALTVGGGVVVYVAGRVIERAFTDPVNAQADAITELIKTLEFYRYVYANADHWFNDAYKADIQEMVQAFRTVAAVLTARNRTLPWYGLLHILGLVPRRARVLLAVAGLQMIIAFVTDRRYSGALVTKEGREKLGDATESIAKMVKGHLNMGDRTIERDLRQYIYELPSEHLEAVIRMYRERKE